jgi:hypothetical protein
MGAASSFCRDCFQDTDAELLSKMSELKDVEAQELTLVSALDQLQKGRDTLPKSVESNILALTSNLQTLAQLKLALGTRIASLQSENQREGRRRVVELVKESARTDAGADDEDERVDALEAGSLETQLVAAGDRATQKIRATAMTLGVSSTEDTLALARSILSRHGKQPLKTVPEETPVATKTTVGAADANGNGNDDDYDEEVLLAKHSEHTSDDVPLIA